MAAPTYPRARLSPAKDELLYEELDLSEEMNERISQEVSELIGSAFE